MSTFREFQTGFTLGQQQRKQMQLDKARADASALFDSGVYEGAESTLMKAGDLEGASAFAQAGQRRKDEEKLKSYGEAFKASGYKGVRDQATQQGDISTAADMDKVIASMDEGEREAAATRAQFLGQAAFGLAQIKDPQARKAAYDQIIATTGQAMGITPQQAASFDLSDESLKGVYMSSMSLADQLKLQEPDKKPEYVQTQLEDGVYFVNKNDPNDKIRIGAGKAPGKGIQLEFGEDGGLSGLSIGGTGTKGKEPAVINSADGSGAAVSPGAQQLKNNKDYNTILSGETQTGLVREDIARALKLINEWTAGPGANLQHLPLIGGSTDAGSVANLLKTIKTNVGFDKLEEMRTNSPTGAALGNVTEKELDFLQSVKGSFAQDQKPAELIRNLERLDRFFKDRDTKRREAFARDYPSLAEYAGFAKGAAAEGNDLKTMSIDELKRRAAELKAKAGKQ